MRICAVLLVVVALVATARAALDPQPVCSNDGSGTSGDGQCGNGNGAVPSASTLKCSVWESYVDGWILAGQSLRRNEPVPGLRPDLVIPWKRHSRRAFPLWGRLNYFYQGSSLRFDKDSESRIGSTTTATKVSDLHDMFVFAPGLHWPLECHKQYANMHFQGSHNGNDIVDYATLMTTSIDAWYESNGGSSSSSSNKNTVMLNPPLVADRAIAFGDPLFLPCVPHDEWPMVQTVVHYSEFPFVNTTENMHAFAECFDPHQLEIREEKKGYGVYTNRNMGKGSLVTWGHFIPMHRTELHDAERDRHEVLLNYCYGHANSSLLFLPAVPMANAMNHHATLGQGTPNVRVQWAEYNGDPRDLFTAPATKLMVDNEMALTLPVQYIATRDIAAGEELLLDYGPEWQAAWTQHVETHGIDQAKDFRHEIGLPLDMVPSAWLEQESLLVQADVDEWLLPKLDPAELKPVALKSGTAVDGRVDRVGLPVGLSEFMAKWADDVGLTDIMRSYILGDLSLPVEGQQRLRLNGATWWMKRFPADWKSDMHYISPDDNESNAQFMQALSDAGFDQVLHALAVKDNLQSITAYYPSFIAVSHCTRAHMHVDSSEDGHYNIIFPTHQTSVPGPELILGDEGKDLYAPYKYEADHAVVLGNEGLHGTAPCDYRATNEMRMVVSIYMADTDDPVTMEKVLHGWEDPPFPRVPDRRKFFEDYKHWRKNDPARNLTSPL